MARGDHVFVRRGRRYTHHGIDCGDGTVIHYVGPRGTERVVARTTLDEFALDGEVRVRTHVARLAPEETVRLAESRLGSTGYHLVRNNCEHLAVWCSTGRATSSQVRRWAVAAPGTVASVLATHSLGVDLAVAGTVGAGLFAARRPLLRR